MSTTILTDKDFDEKGVYIGDRYSFDSLKIDTDCAKFNRYIDVHGDLIARGNLYARGGLIVLGDAYAMRDLDVRRRLDVRGCASVNGDLNINVDTDLGGYLSVGGLLEYEGEAHVLGIKLLKKRAFFSVNRIDSLHTQTLFCFPEDPKKEIMVFRGCWSGSISAFEDRVKSVHSKTIYKQEYLNAIRFAKETRAIYG